MGCVVDVLYKRCERHFGLRLEQLKHLLRQLDHFGVQRFDFRAGPARFRQKMHFSGEIGILCGGSDKAHTRVSLDDNLNHITRAAHPFDDSQRADLEKVTKARLFDFRLPL